MLSLEEYSFLEALSDSYWARRAKEAEKEGTIGVAATEKYLASILKNEKRTLKASD